MSHRQMTRLVREGDYIAEVSVDLIEAEGGWSPYLTLDDAYRLDDIRDALRRGDMRTASRMARVYRLTPVESQLDASWCEARDQRASMPSRTSSARSAKARCPVACRPGADRRPRFSGKEPGLFRVLRLSPSRIADRIWMNKKYSTTAS